MGDINLLPETDRAPEKRSGSNKSAQDEDLALHVPVPEPPVRPGGSKPLSLGGKKEEREALPPEKLLSQKVEPIPAFFSDKSLPPLVEKPVGAAEKSPKPSVLPKPPISPPPPAASEEKAGEVLRVSLITGNGGSGLSDLALKRRLRMIAVIGILGLVLNGIVYAGLRQWRVMLEKRSFDARQSVQETDAKIADREAALAGIRDFQALSWAAARVLDAHAHWTEVLKLLEQRALPEVRFGSLAGAETGTLGFEVTAKDYTTLARQIVAFREDPRVKNVTVGTASADLGDNQLLKGVRSSVTLVLDPGIFRYKSQAAEAEAPQP